MTQQIQKTSGQIRKESRELPSTNTFIMLRNCILEETIKN